MERPRRQLRLAWKAPIVDADADETDEEQPTAKEREKDGPLTTPLKSVMSTHNLQRLGAATEAKEAGANEPATLSAVPEGESKESEADRVAGAGANASQSIGGEKKEGDTQALLSDTGTPEAPASEGKKPKKAVGFAATEAEVPPVPASEVEHAWSSFWTSIKYMSFQTMVQDLVRLPLPRPCMFRARLRHLAACLCQSCRD